MEVVASSVRLAAGGYPETNFHSTTNFNSTEDVLCGRMPLVGLVSFGRCWEFADFDVAEGDGKAVVLQEEVTLVGFAEVGIDVELAGGDEGPELGGIAVVFDNLDAVQPMLSVGSAYDDAGGVPLASGPDWFRSCCRDQVVE